MSLDEAEAVLADLVKERDWMLETVKNSLAENQRQLLLSIERLQKVTEHYADAVIKAEWNVQKAEEEK